MQGIGTEPRPVQCAEGMINAAYAPGVPHKKTAWS